MNLFSRFWQAHGRPECTVIEHHDEWVANLPTGYAYDPELDGVYAAGGVQLEDLSPYWTSVDIAYFPITGSFIGLNNKAHGIIEDGKTRICVQYEDALPFYHCFAVIVGDRLLRVESYDDTTPDIFNVVLVDR